MFVVAASVSINRLGAFCDRMRLAHVTGDMWRVCLNVRKRPVTPGPISSELPGLMTGAWSNSRRRCVPARRIAASGVAIVGIATFYPELSWRQELIATLDDKNYSLHVSIEGRKFHDGKMTDKLAAATAMEGMSSPCLCCPQFGMERACCSAQCQQKRAKICNC